MCHDHDVSDVQPEDFVDPPWADRRFRSVVLTVTVPLEGDEPLELTGRSLPAPPGADFVEFFHLTAAELAVLGFPIRHSWWLQDREDF